MRIRLRAREPATLRAGQAASLATRLEMLCELGIRVRALGWCLGELEPSSLELEADHSRLVETLRLIPRIRAWCRQRLHLRRGHDAGCRAVGVPQAVLFRLLRSWDRAESAGLLSDATDEFVREIAHLEQRCGGWDAPQAQEAVQAAIRARISPAQTQTGPPGQPDRDDPVCWSAELR